MITNNIATSFPDFHRSRPNIQQLSSNTSLKGRLTAHCLYAPRPQCVGRKPWEPTQIFSRGTGSKLFKDIVQIVFPTKNVRRFSAQFLHSCLSQTCFGSGWIRRFSESGPGFFFISLDFISFFTGFVNHCSLKGFLWGIFLKIFSFLYSFRFIPCNNICK